MSTSTRGRTHDRDTARDWQLSTPSSSRRAQPTNPIYRFGKPDQAINFIANEWLTPDKSCIAEYFICEPIYRTLRDRDVHGHPSGFAGYALSVFNRLPQTLRYGPSHTILFTCALIKLRLRSSRPIYTTLADCCRKTFIGALLCAADVTESGIIADNWSYILECKLGDLKQIRKTFIPPGVEDWITKDGIIKAYNEVVTDFGGELAQYSPSARQFLKNYGEGELFLVECARS